MRLYKYHMMPLWGHPFLTANGRVTERNEWPHSGTVTLWLDDLHVMPATVPDVDECQGPTECDASADCLNIPGGYHCQCREGFVGDGTLCTGYLLTTLLCSKVTAAIDYVWVDK